MYLQLLCIILLYILVDERNNIIAESKIKFHIYTLCTIKILIIIINFLKIMYSYLYVHKYTRVNLM
jgi:hypothetical protein